MQGDDVVAFFGAFESGYHLGLLGLKLLHPGNELFGRHTRDDDGVNNPLHLAPDLAEPPFQPGAFGARLLLQPLARGVIGINIFGDHRGMREMLAQSLDRQGFEIVEIDAPTVAARAAFFVGAALQAHTFAVGAVRGHAATAGAASDQSREHSLRRARLLCRCRRRVAASFDLDDLRCLKRRVVDDAQVRRFDDLILLFRIGTRQALASCRVLHHPHFVPNDATGIEIVQDHAAAARDVAVDGRAVPKPAARRAHAARVEIVRDLARCLVGDVVRKNLANDIGLFLHDLKLAGLAFDGTVAIGASASVPTIAQDTFKAAPGVHTEVLDELLAHERAQGAVDCTNLAGCGVQGDAEEVEPLARIMIVSLITEDAIHILGDNDIKQSALGRLHQSLKAWAVDGGRSRNRAVFERRDHCHALACAKIAAKGDLIVDTTIFLPVG